MKVIENFCTLGAGRPLSTQQAAREGRPLSQGQLDKDLYAALKNKVSIINADAASVEIATLEELDDKTVGHFPQ